MDDDGIHELRCTVAREDKHGAACNRLLARIVGEGIADEKCLRCQTCQRFVFGPGRKTQVVMKWEGPLGTPPNPLI